MLEPVTTFGSPLLVGVQPMPFTALQSAFDALYPAGLQWYWRADFFNEISDAAIAVHEKYGALLPTGHSTMHLYPIDGAASRVPEDATAFAYRDGGWAGIIVGVDPDPANAERITQWATGLLAGVAPDLGRRRLRQLPHGRGPGADQGRPTATTTTGWPRSSGATTRTTRSTSTRTSSPPDRRRGSR